MSLDLEPTGRSRPLGAPYDDVLLKSFARRSHAVVKYAQLWRTSTGAPVCEHVIPEVELLQWLANEGVPDDAPLCPRCALPEHRDGEDFPDIGFGLGEPPDLPPPAPRPTQARVLSTDPTLGNRLHQAFTHPPQPFAPKKPYGGAYRMPDAPRLVSKRRDVIVGDRAFTVDITEVAETGPDNRKNVVTGTMRFDSGVQGLMPVSAAEQEVARSERRPVRMHWSSKMWIAYTRYGDRGPVLGLHHGVPTNRRQKWPVQQLCGPFFRTIAWDFLGMGDSAKPRLYGKREKEGVAYTLVREQIDDAAGEVIAVDMHAPEKLGEYTAWYWREDTDYVDALMQAVFPDERFIYESDDWGSGPGVHYAARFGSRRLLASVFTDPIAFDGYPVKEIEAIGRAHALSDTPFAGAMGAFDQTLWQIYKTMVHQPDRVYDQYTMRDIIFPYAWVDYERGASSTTMGLNMHNIHVLADRASILSPALLLPRGTPDGFTQFTDRERASLGVDYHDVDVSVLVMWGEKDNMMPAAQGTARFANAMQRAPVQVHYVPDAGHFAGTDQPEFVAETIINFGRELHRRGELGQRLAQPFVGYYIPRWKGDERLLLADLQRIEQDIDAGKLRL